MEDANNNQEEELDNTGSKTHVRPLGKVERTGRGFEIVRFKDIYKNEASLQMSSIWIGSNPGCSAVWLGLDDGNGGAGVHRMHLDVGQVTALIMHLTNWVNVGSFEIRAEAKETK